jgi:hypothetical protein
MYLVAYKQQKFISHSSGGRVLVNTLFWVADCRTLTLHGERGEGALWGAFSKGPTPIHEVFGIMTKSPIKGPPPNAHSGD